MFSLRKIFTQAPQSLSGSDGNEYPTHPLLSEFPEMGEAAFQGLKQSILDVGQQDDICLMDGQVIDGRSRLRACRELGIEPRTRESPTVALDLLATWIEGRNLHRRHLTEAQRSMVAARMATWRGSTLEVAAETMSVSRASVVRAKAVLASGDTNVIRLVDRGKASVTSAHAAVQAKRGRPTGDADCHAMRRLLTGLDALLRKDKPWPDDLRSLAARLSVALAAIAEGQDERASA